MWPRGDRLPSTWVEVRLAEGPEHAIACSETWSLRGADGAVLQTGEALPPRTELEVTTEGIRLGPFRFKEPSLELRPGSGGLLRLGEVSYRGRLRIDRLPARPGAPARLRLSNQLSVEEYLRGVLPGEMPDHFGLSALKAQAIAARSYALAEMLDRGWLWPDARSQVYGGHSLESRLADKAVAETRGLVLVTGDRVLTAWFHSTCGGSTRPAGEIYPYPPKGALETPVVCNDCRSSPYWRWERRIPWSRAAAALELSVSQRPTSLRVQPDSLPAYINQIEMRIDGEPRNWSADRFRSLVSRGQKNADALLSVHWTAPPKLVGEELVVRGAGWGHGVGLCQYGAAGAAARGWDERRIVEHYYPGASLARLQ